MTEPLKELKAQLAGAVFKAQLRQSTAQLVTTLVDTARTNGATVQWEVDPQRMRIDLSIDLSAIGRRTPDPADFLPVYPIPPGAILYPAFDDLPPAVPDIEGRHKKGRCLMNFSAALEALKDGKRIARSGWNGKGMFLFLVPGSNFKVNREPLLSIMGEGAEVTYRPHIDMKDAEGKVVPWLASQTDILANDWEVVGI
jgi:hypothetical protein